MKNKSKLPLFILIFPMIFLIIGTVLFGIGVKGKIDRAKIADEYYGTIGIFCDYDIYSSSSGSRNHEGQTYNLCYEYFVDEERYTVWIGYGVGYLPERNSTEMVYYNPENPREAFVGGVSTNDLFLFIGGMFIGIPLVILIILYEVFKDDKKTKTKRHDDENLNHRKKINVVDLSAGTLLVLMGAGIFYIIVGEFNLKTLFERASFFGIIPVLFVVVGGLTALRGLFGKEKEEE